MKKVLCLGLVSMFSVAALAAKTPESACRVEYKGRTIDVTDGNKFFSAANEIAVKDNVCVHAKIAYLEKSGRVYSGKRNGQLLAADNGKKRDLSLNEAAQAARNSGESCIHLACNEIGVLRGNEPLSNEIIVIPSISIDSQHGGGGY